MLQAEEQPGYFTYKAFEKKTKAALGDVSGNGDIDIEDVVMVISHVNVHKALTDDEAERADVDSNSDVDIEDAVAIIAHVNGVKAIGKLFRADTKICRLCFCPIIALLIFFCMKRNVHTM